MSDDDAPDERRTEGVRIIGAQEAAAAAERPDVVRRRRGSEKRYGDRPDAPADVSDLPKITISTTEGEGGEQYGRSGVARPENDPSAPDPQWADSGPGAYDDPERAGYGHARLVPAAAADPADEDPAAASVAPGAEPSESDAGRHEAVGVPEWDEPYVAPTWSRDDDPFGTPASSEQYEPFAELPNRQHSDSLQEPRAEVVDETSADQDLSLDAPSTTWDRRPRRIVRSMIRGSPSGPPGPPQELRRPTPVARLPATSGPVAMSAGPRVPTRRPAR